jgi:hypothetical protein
MDDSGPVSVAFIQKYMIRYLNNTNPPTLTFRDNNPEDSPIDRIPGHRFEKSHGKAASVIMALQSGDRTLRPLGEITGTTSKESKHSLIGTGVTHLSAALLRLAATVKARWTNSPTLSGGIAAPFRLMDLARTVLPATTIRQVLPIVMMPPS